jgi:NAD(P)-dependent dehydrogenase (short-subunit alcohol dehydrogenase family)
MTATLSADVRRRRLERSAAARLTRPGTGCEGDGVAAPQPMTCLVTGAGRGIGAAVAQMLSAQGHRVALTARSANQLHAVADALPGPSLVFPADITAHGTVDNVFAAVEEEFGPVQILVANAGAATSAPVHRVTDEDWQASLDLNLTAPFRCIRRAVPAMKAAGYGRIVVMASMAARAGEPYISAYVAAKHGVLGLVRAAASELVRSGVTVNAVCPAYVDTAMTDGSVDMIVASTRLSAAEARTYLENKQPIGRLITTDEVVEAVRYCLANSAVTGQGLNVDGGLLQS